MASNSTSKFLLALLLMVSTAFAFANGDRVYFECPCSLDYDGAGAFELTVGLRNFSRLELGPFEVQVVLRDENRQPIPRAPSLITIEIPDRVNGESTLESATYAASLDSETELEDLYHVELVLSADGNWHDKLLMDQQVDLRSNFEINNLDYLIDSDEDGVGDLNEQYMGTDPNDAESIPGESEIDVLVLYSKGFSDEYSGDPTTRIKHVFELANQILEDSDLKISWRLVGLVQVEIDEQNTTLRDVSVLQEQGERHGSDLVVLFGPFPEKGGYCGRAPLLGLYSRGHIPHDQLINAHAKVVGPCGATTLAHELGHVMGLGHTAWQNNVGTWRWSRGHALPLEFYTVMSYGGRGGQSIGVFSDPHADCSEDDSDEDHPCGVPHDEVDAADAVASLDAVRFQIASFRDSFPDRDNDGFVDPVDDLPDNPREWADTDEDGIGNNTDLDDDGDGVADLQDAFPLDASETVDSDGDGIGDNGDLYPNDPTEWADFDGDGIGDNGDQFPEDSTEWVDSDSDGVGDNGDPFPEDPTEWLDSDDDGIGNNSDNDDDGDSVLDINDPYPLDSSRSDFISYKFIGESDTDRVGIVVSGRISTEPASDILLAIGVPNLTYAGRHFGGAYLIGLNDLQRLDVADGSMDRIVDLTNVTSGLQSWKFVSHQERSEAGSSVSFGDIDGDGSTEIFVGAQFDSEGGNRAGAVYIFPIKDLQQFDEADGTADRTIFLNQFTRVDSGWKLAGDSGNRLCGAGRFSVGDVDSDNRDDMLFGNYLRTWDDDDMTTVSYLVLSSELETLDESDGYVDGFIDLSEHSESYGVFEFADNDLATGKQYWYSVDVGEDINADGTGDILIGRRAYRSGLDGAVFLLSGTELSEAAEDSGGNDGTIELQDIRHQDDSWKFTGLPYWNLGWKVAGIHDYSNDTKKDIALVSEFAIDFVASSDLRDLDAADGDVNGLIDLKNIEEGSNSFSLRGVRTDTGVHSGNDSVFFSSTNNPPFGAFLLKNEALMELIGKVPSHFSYHQNAPAAESTLQLRGPRKSFYFGQDISAVPDFDSDGSFDLLVSANSQRQERANTILAYLISTADISSLKSIDEKIDNLVLVEDLFGDSDNDGVMNFSDVDDDNDGVNDSVDDFQFNELEWKDSDWDGYGDNSDAFPKDPGEWLDTDGDGIGDNRDRDDDADGIPDNEDEYPLDTDNDGLNNDVDEDDDNDGVLDSDDDLPYDETETSDWDLDGIGDNADTDDDNDGVSDDNDAFPFDPSESTDTDGDGVGDNSDDFPDDSEEWLDTDGDGTGNNADTDDDNDGVPDVNDAFPLDPSRAYDSDMDGVVDSDDAFPNDPDEWSDLDGDNIGDNSDPDIDGDGALNQDDVFPNDATRSDLLSITFVEQVSDEEVGVQVGQLGDVDVDEQFDILIAARNSSIKSFVYLLAGAELQEADSMDGTLDGMVEVENVTHLSQSWKLVVPEEDDGGIYAMSRVGAITEKVGPLTNADEKQEDAFLVGTSAGLYSDAYVISPTDLLAADAEDGRVDRIVHLDSIASYSNSWRFSYGWRTALGYSSVFVGDIDGDALDDICIGAPSVGAGDLGGTVFVVPTSQLHTLDTIDGSSEDDGVISLGDGRLHLLNQIWRFEGEFEGDGAGAALAAADFDGDDLADLVIGADRHDGRKIRDGSVYVVARKDWEATDETDGSNDRKIDLGLVASMPNSWKLVGSHTNGQFGSKVVAGDLYGTGARHLVVTQRHSVDIISSSDFSGIDAADGTLDGIVEMAFLGSGSDSWRIATPCSNCSIALVDDAAGSGIHSLFVGKGNRIPSVGTIAYLLASSDFAYLDEIDGEIDRTFDLERVYKGLASFEFRLEKVSNNLAQIRVVNAGDIDGDKRSDILIGVEDRSTALSWQLGPSQAFFISSAELAYLDEMDGSPDGIIYLDNVTARERRTLDSN